MITITASCLSYEPGFLGEKKVNGNWEIIDKNWYSLFHTSKRKSKSSNSLRELIFILTLLPCSWLKRRFSVKKNFALIIHMFLYDRYGVGMEQVLEAPGPADIVLATGVKNCSKAL